MMKERNVKFDILRGIGIVLMIMGHIDFGLEFSHYIHAFHMPIFFFVTGFFFNRGRGIWDSIKHDLRTLILPYSVFWALCQVLHYLYTHEFSLQYSVLSYFTSNHNRIDVSGVYWFLLCLFTARQLFWIINTVRNENGKLVLVLILTLVGNNLRQFAKLPLCLDSAMSAVLLMYLGFQYRKFQNHAWVKHLMNLSVWQILLGLAGNAWLIMLNGTVNLRTNYYANIPLYWLNSIVAVWLLLQLCAKLEKSQNRLSYNIGKTLAYLGKNSIVFLVLNELMIFAVNVFFGFIGLELSWLILKMATLIAVMTGLSILNEIINRTKLRFIIGKQ